MNHPNINEYRFYIIKIVFSYPSSHLQVNCSLLPEVLVHYFIDVWIDLSLNFSIWVCRRWWSFQEGDQGHPDWLRQEPPCCWSQEVRAKEVRRSRSPCQIPEILPLKLGLSLFRPIKLIGTVTVMSVLKLLLSVLLGDLSELNNSWGIYNIANTWFWFGLKYGFDGTWCLVFGPGFFILGMVGLELMFVWCYFLSLVSLPTAQLPVGWSDCIVFKAIGVYGWDSILWLELVDLFEHARWWLIASLWLWHQVALWWFSVWLVYSYRYFRILI